MKGNIISVVMLLLAGTLTAQTKVSGIVTDVKGQPVRGQIAARERVQAFRNWLDR